MSTSTYPASIFVASGHEEGVLLRVADALRAAGAQVETSGDWLRATLGEGRFAFRLNQHEGIEVENAEIVEACAQDHQEKAEIAKSKLRLEMRLEGDDPFMDFFNDALILRGVAAKAAPGWSFDPLVSAFD